MVHQYAEVVAQVRACNTKRPHAREHQQLSEGEKRTSKDWLIKLWCEWLRTESRVEEIITNYADGENGGCEEVAAIVWGAEDAREDLVVVL